MIRPTDRLTVTMEAQAWEAAMRWLAKAPYEAVAGLIGDIQRQCADQPSEQPPDTAREMMFGGTRQ